MPGNWHVRCGAGEKSEIASNAYLLLTIVHKHEETAAGIVAAVFSSNGQYSSTIGLQGLGLIRANISAGDPHNYATLNY